MKVHLITCNGLYTWPAKKPCILVFPARNCSNCFGFSESTLSTIFSISAGSTICYIETCERYLIELKKNVPLMISLQHLCHVQSLKL
ncbi:hypothetical protein OIU79_007075, partial [Salix purpurea]